MNRHPAAAVVRLLRTARSVAVTCHARPDGDALASALLLLRGLRRLGKTALLVTPHPLPGNFAFLFSRIKDLRRIPVLTPEHAKARADLLAVLDSSNLGRLEWTPSPLRFPRMVDIDHHADNARFGDAAFVDTTAPAAGLAVLGLLRRLGIRPDSADAELLFVSLYSDTAGLTVPNDRVPEALTFCLRHGADIPSLIAALRRRSLPVLRLGSRVFGRLTRAAAGVYWTWVTRRDLRDAEAGPESFDAILEDLGRLEGAEVFFVLKETGPRTWRVSIRSRGADVHRVAAAFGGGGHKRASGFPISGTAEDCARRIVRTLRRRTA